MASQNSVLLIWSQEQMFDRIVRVLENARIEVLAFLNAYTLTITTDNERFQIPKREARKRGVKLRYITEITRDNLSYCKRQIDLVDELRHLGSIKTNFLLNEHEFMASQEISPRHPITEGFYTDVKKIVKLQGYVFETLWDNAIPAPERIKQMESAGENVIERDYRSFDDKKAQKRVIDRFYVCPQCNATYIFTDEAAVHQKDSGHQKAKEFPFFD